MSRTILHADMNGFYASVECLYNPSIRNKPVVVGGDVEARHGIVLAKNEIAKKYKIQTGEVLWQAKQRCPNLVVVPPNYKRYLEFSKLSREIYCEYTDRVEPFGLDEAFLDVGGSEYFFGNGKTIADTIRERIKVELGVTVSVGVSYNKIFSKLGSDMKKPDATTVITKTEYKEKVWPLPVGDLLYVGRATEEKLRRYCIKTIGALAQTNPERLAGWFGKNGHMLWLYANGEDPSLVSRYEDVKNDESGMKSIGNSTTTPRDLLNIEDVKITVYLLSESVASRLREHRQLCRTVQLWLRDNKLSSFERQMKLSQPSQLAKEIVNASMALFKQSCPGFGEPYSTIQPFRSVGVRASDLVREEDNIQLSLFPEERKRQNLMMIERTMDDIRRRYGHFTISRGLMMSDRKLSNENPKDDHISIFPGGK